MKSYKRAILTHGGSASDPNHSDGPYIAAQKGMHFLKNGKTPIEAVVKAVRSLEKDPRFNAGCGSQIRSDGKTIQMDASCMMSSGEFGAVACVQGIQNPIDIAHEILLNSSHILLIGDGACVFAKDQNINVIPQIISTEDKPFLKLESRSCDTVGAVAFDGKTYAAALSSGGLKNSPIGRVGDVPLPGCGLYCGPLGAIACTGDGEFIALRILAKEIYDLLGQNISPTEAAKKAMELFDDSVDIGLIILTKNEFASNSRHGMAWSQITERE
jgi:beta-aspartyl-peptidase (threonine type)